MTEQITRENSSFFRSRIEPTPNDTAANKNEATQEPKKPTEHETSPDDKEMPVELLKAADKAPFIMKALNLPENLYKHFKSTKLQTEEIDSFVLQTIKGLDLKITKENYQKVVDQYKSKLNFKADDEVDPYTLIEKLHQLLKIDAKIRQAVKDREDLMKADISQLSASQLKKRLLIEGVKSY